MADDNAPGSALLPTGPDLAADDLQQVDREPNNMSTLCGFFGTSDTPNNHRLFTDATLKFWVDIRDEDIRYRRPIAGEHDACGGRSVVGVRSGAHLVRGEVTSAGAEADFLSGPLSREASGQLGDESLAGGTQGPKFLRNFAGSPYLTKPGPPCC